MLAMPSHLLLAVERWRAAGVAAAMENKINAQINMSHVHRLDMLLLAVNFIRMLLLLLLKGPASLRRGYTHERRSESEQPIVDQHGTAADAAKVSHTLNSSRAQLLTVYCYSVYRLDFLNNEESQSSMMSSVSQIDSNQGQSVDTIIGSALKRPKKKKMEICVAEE